MIGSTLALAAITASSPAAARTHLEDPGETLWLLSKAPEARALDAYRSAGGDQVRASTDVRAIVNAAVHRLETNDVAVADLPEGSRGGRLHSREVVLAIATAAVRTGAPASLLLRTARRESGLNPLALSRTSTAAGLFQFVEDSWLRSVSLYGARHGLAREAAMIVVSASGRVEVGPIGRRHILSLRFDPRIASLMAAEVSLANRRMMMERLGRAIADHEVYVAHFLGPAGAVRLISAAEDTPDESAVGLLPQAAAAIPSIFTRQGRPLSAAQLLRRLTRG